MIDKARRRELRSGYRLADRGAGIYLIRIAGSGRSLLGSTNDLAALHNRLSFAKSTGSASALDLRLRADLLRYGMSDVTIEVLDTLPVTPGMTPREVADDLAALQEMWRERLDATTLY